MGHLDALSRYRQLPGPGHVGKSYGSYDPHGISQLLIGDVPPDLLGFWGKLAWPAGKADLWIAGSGSHADRHGTAFPTHTCQTGSQKFFVQWRNLVHLLHYVFSDFSSSGGSLVSSSLVHCFGMLKDSFNQTQYPHWSRVGHRMLCHRIVKCTVPIQAGDSQAIVELQTHFLASQVIILVSSFLSFLLPKYLVLRLVTILFVRQSSCLSGGRFRPRRKSVEGRCVPFLSWRMTADIFLTNLENKNLWKCKPCKHQISGKKHQVLIF